MINGAIRTNMRATEMIRSGRSNRINAVIESPPLGIVSCLCVIWCKAGMISNQSKKPVLARQIGIFTFGTEATPNNLAREGDRNKQCYTVKSPRSSNSADTKRLPRLSAAIELCATHAVCMRSCLFGRETVSITEAGRLQKKLGARARASRSFNTSFCHP